MKTMTSKIFFRWIFWAITAIIMLIIFLNSAKNATQSSEVSISFTEKLFSVLVPDFESMDENEKVSFVASAQFLIRKSAHFLSYFSMGFFCFLAINTYAVKIRRKFLLSTAICVIFSITDEIHQLFVPGRSGEVRDVLIDSSGILLATSILTFILYKIKKRKENSSEQTIKSSK